MKPQYDTIAQGLRDLADFLEQHPEAVSGLAPRLSSSLILDKSSFRDLMRTLEPIGFEREETASFLNLVKRFGPVTYEVSYYRSGMPQPVIKEDWPEPIAEEEAA